MSLSLWKPRRWLIEIGVGVTLVFWGMGCQGSSGDGTEGDSGLIAEVPSSTSSSAPTTTLPKDSAPSVLDETPPQVKNTLLDLSGSYDAAQKRLGALLCTAPQGESPPQSCFVPFGVGSSAQSRFRFVTVAQASIKAVTDGIVSEIEFLEHTHLSHSDIYLILVKASTNSTYRWEYGHLKNPTVRVGDSVKAGQVLGLAGDYLDEEHGMVWLALRKGFSPLEMRCPLEFDQANLRPLYQQALEAANQAWPSLAQSQLCGATAFVCLAGPESCRPTVTDVFITGQGNLTNGQKIYANSCAICHGAQGEGGISVKLQGCKTCSDFETLRLRIERDMPPEDTCVGACAWDTATYILNTFNKP